MAKEKKWLTQQQLANELTEKLGKDIKIQRVNNWVTRNKIRWKKVYGNVILVDKTSLQIDLEKDLEEK